MTDERQILIGKYLSRHLRHSPEELGLTLELGGWVAIDALIAGSAGKGFAFTREELEAVVAGSDKQRFAIDETGLKIRANQGHSAEVDLQLEPAEPPPTLFHGTAQATINAILRQGLRKMARHHVHLSADTETALKVGRRHGQPIILQVDAKGMRTEGYQFFRSANGVWLVDAIPPRFLRVL